MKFTCSKCGACCKNLIIPMGRWQLGLSLLAPERNLFPRELVSPMSAVGKDEPEEIIQFQLNVSNCIYLKNSKCSIYKRRPISCRSFPLTVSFFEGTFIGASVGENCPQTRDIAHKSLPLTVFPISIIAANMTRNQYMDKVLKDNLFMFDLKTKTWSKMTKADAAAMMDTHFH